MEQQRTGIKGNIRKKYSCKNNNKYYNNYILFNFFQLQLSNSTQSNIQ